MTDVFAHPWLRGLFADDEMAALWSARAQLRHMLAFEAAWSRNGHLAGLWTEAEGTSAAEAILGVSLDMAVLSEGTGRDGVCVPSLVRLLKAEAGEAVHKGATSQDVIDTATALSIRATVDLLTLRIKDMMAAFEQLEDAHGTAQVMGRTRMQAALPMKFATRLAAWRAPFAGHLDRLSRLQDQVCRVQIGGPVGDRRGLEDQAPIFAEALANDLSLASTKTSWHVARDGIADFASALSLISGALGKFGQDIALMAQMDEIELEGGGGSSAMPHKQNPILAELLVTLARFNSVQVSGMHHALVHEQERSGSAWVIEWMILPQMAQATGRGLTAALDICRNVQRIGAR